MWKSLKGLNAYRNIILRQHINATNGVSASYMGLFSAGQIRPVLLESDIIFKIPSISFNRNLHTTLAIYKPKNLPNDKSDKPQGPAGEDDNDNNKNNRDTNEKIKAILTKIFFWILTFYSIVAFMSLLLKSKTEELETASKYITWNEFIHYILPTGEIKEIIIRPNLDLVTIILHEGAIIRGRPAPSTTYHMAIADSAKFEQRLRQIEERMGITEGVAIIYDRSSDVTNSIITILIIAAIIGILAQRMKGFKSPIGMDIFSQMGRAKFTLVDPFDGGRGVLFKDVAGLKEAKQEVLEFVDYLKSPDKYQKLGAKVPRGALLLGPPGCGKTLLAKAVATEAQVPFLSMNGSEFIEMIGGLGAARVRDLFREGYKRAPCIIYIDEIDAIGRHRSDNGMNKARSGESEQTLNQLLVEMDGVASKDGVLTLASTNRADILDKALLRPGRFDRHILIDLPTLQERKEIFETYLAIISLDFEPTKYSSRLAWLTPGFSGADIANVCNEAALHAARNSQAKVQAKNLEYAVERLVGGTEKRSHALSAQEREVLAYHEAGHALACWLLPNIDPLLKVTIVPRTNLTLGFTQLAPSEQKLYSKEELFDKMCVALGGRAAENLIFKRVTTGAQNDLNKVTQIAYSKIKKFGMNEIIGPMYITDAEEVNSYAKPFSKALQQIMDHEVRKSVSRAYEITENLMKANRDKLEKLALALLKKETLNYDEIVELIGPPPNKEKRMVEYSF